VEDNPANLRLVQKMLAEREDVEVIAASSAEAGLEIAVQARPDLILLDINLPGMDGFEALRSLRTNPVTRDIPVVAITANAMPRDLERGRAAGFSDYLIKPLDVARFHQVVDRYLKRIGSDVEAGS
jgi:CheY-like chemotaxis protein